MVTLIHCCHQNIRVATLKSKALASVNTEISDENFYEQTKEDKRVSRNMWVVFATF